MKLSTRVRYGVRAMVELAKQGGDKPVPLRALAENQNISAKYLEQMATTLKIAGLVESVRGAVGGYRLARAPEEITIWDIYECLDVSVELVDCWKNPCSSECERCEYCSARELWTEISDKVESILKSHTLADLAQRETQLQHQQTSQQAEPTLPIQPPLSQP